MLSLVTRRFPDMRRITCRYWRTWSFILECEGRVSRNADFFGRSEADRDFVQPVTPVASCVGGKRSVRLLLSLLFLDLRGRKTRAERNQSCELTDAVNRFG